MNLLSTTALLAVSFFLFLVALPLLSFGTMGDQQLLWYLGLGMVVLAGLLPPVARFVAAEDGDEDDDGGDDEEADESIADKAADDAADHNASTTDGDADATDRRPPDEGPVGHLPAAPGREPNRARIEEQRERAGEADADKEDRQ